jgi:hypothetical protein
MVADEEMVAGEEIVSILAGEDMVADKEMVAGEEMVSILAGEDMVADKEMVAGEEMVTSSNAICASKVSSNSDTSSFSKS